MFENEFDLLARIVLVFVYFYMFWFFRKNFYKSKAAGFVNKFFVGYAFFFLALFGVQVGLAISELSGYLLPGSDAWIHMGFPGSDDPANLAKVILFPKMVVPVYILGLSAMLVLIAGQIYPLEVTLSWKRLPGTKFLIIAAAVMPLIFIPAITWSFVATILCLTSIIGVLYGLLINVGVNARLAAISTGDIRLRSIAIIFASILFYVGFIITLEIKEISPSNVLGIDQRWDIVIGSIIQGISALLYRQGLKVRT